MDQTKNLSATEDLHPPSEGSRGSSDETRDPSGTEDAQPPGEGWGAPTPGDPSRIGRYPRFAQPLSCTLGLVR
jgi:hypothetical protein